MSATRLFIALFCVLFFLCACGEKKQTQPDGTSKTQAPDLMPKEDLDALMNPPDYLDDIADGSAEDTLNDNLRMQPDELDDPYQKALVSTRIIAEFDKRNIRLPGFIVPLDFDDHQVITSFLLVPFFGACIHYPPPPPNQIIFATYEPGLRLDDLSDAFFVEGTIFTELKEHDLATSAYSMTIDRILPYEED
jgi:hypothetical protein